MQHDLYVPGQRARRVYADVPAELVGKWTDGQGLYEIKANGLYYVGDVTPCHLFTISADGGELTLSGTVYVRTAGSGTQILGIWYCATAGEELHFRADGTYTSHWDDGEELYGTYRVAEDKMAFAECRAVIRVDGTQFTFDVFYAPEIVCTYALSGNQLSFTCPSSSFTLTRVD